MWLPLYHLSCIITIFKQHHQRYFSHSLSNFLRLSRYILFTSCTLHYLTCLCLPPASLSLTPVYQSSFSPPLISLLLMVLLPLSITPIIRPSPSLPPSLPYPPSLFFFLSLHVLSFSFSLPHNFWWSSFCVLFNVFFLIYILEVYIQVDLILFFTHYSLSLSLSLSLSHLKRIIVEHIPFV